MPRLSRPPAYRRHVSGSAIVTINYRTVYLGPHGSAASKIEYDRVIAEWLANGRQMAAPNNSPIAVSDLILRYWQQHVSTYYVKHGQPSSEQSCIKIALRPLKRLYAGTLATEFGPLALETVRNALIADGRVRTQINKAVHRITRMFKWAVSKELVPVDVYTRLRTVSGLSKGRSAAKESDPVTPIADQFVQATLRHVSNQVAAMIQFQQLTGARPGEVCEIQGRQIDMTGPVWTYTPATHKTEHHDHHRVIAIGPRAQEVLRPFIRIGYLFSPEEAEAERRRRRTAARKTPATHGNTVGSNRAAKPKRPPGEFYTVNAYRKAITRGCDTADAWAKGGRVIGNDDRIIQRWHPHQLRHNAATRLRKEFGIEAAQTILGHKNISVTELYAETNREESARIAQQFG